MVSSSAAMPPYLTSEEATGLAWERGRPLHPTRAGGTLAAGSLCSFTVASISSPFGRMDAAKDTGSREGINDHSRQSEGPGNF